MASKKPAAKAAKKAAPAAKKAAPAAKKTGKGAAPAPSTSKPGEVGDNEGGATDQVRSTLPIAATAGNAPDTNAVATTEQLAAAAARPPAPPAQMPLYKSHKQVRAAKIESVRDDWAEQGVHVEGIGLVRMGDEWMARHKPVVGGYLVEYEDGYQSFSPAEAFESGYTRVKG